MDIGQRWIAEVARGASRSANSSAERDTGRSQSVKFHGYCGHVSVGLSAARLAAPQSPRAHRHTASYDRYRAFT